MISIFNTYKLYNENTDQVLEEGDWIDNFSYYDKNHKIIWQNIQIININENDITIELDEIDKIIINIKDIIEWDKFYL